jgi:hypothetical protein
MAALYAKRKRNFRMRKTLIGISKRAMAIARRSKLR